jgi:hypothetical protein
MVVEGAMPIGAANQSKSPCRGASEMLIAQQYDG